MRKALGYVVVCNKGLRQKYRQLDGSVRKEAEESRIFCDFYGKLAGETNVVLIQNTGVSIIIGKCKESSRGQNEGFYYFVEFTS